MTIGALAKQYRLLPSEVRARATTYDIMVYDVMMTWEEDQRKKANGERSVPKLKQEDMRAMLERVRQNDGRNK